MLQSSVPAAIGSTEQRSSVSNAVNGLKAPFELRGAESLRSIMGLCALIKQHSGTAINSACSKALKAGTYRFKDLRRLIGPQSAQKTLAFADSHPLIRDLSVYSNFINQCHTHEQQLP